MSRLIPTGNEIAVFAIVAIVSASLVALAGVSDLAILLSASPIFCVAAFMGMRRSGQLAAAEPIEDEV